VSSNNRKTGNLVALGSAAVVAVYGAGFMRTAAAAERFALQSDARVLSPAEAEVIAAMANAAAGGVAASTNQPPTPADARPLDSANAGQLASFVADAKTVGATTSNNSAKQVGSAKTKAANRNSAPAEVGASVHSSSRAARSAAPNVEQASTATANATAASAAPAVAATASAPAAVTATTTASTSLALIATTSTAPIATTGAPATPTSSPSAGAPPASTPVAATPAAAPAAKVEEPATTATPVESKPTLKWKDGSYTGYGSSRHGDIEVYLETDGGKISYIKISQCLTQYSCSWISHLPGQVIARQGPQVDGVSGATQSVNAFYYAVVQALSKAK